MFSSSDAEKSAPDLSVVIPYFNHPELLRNALDDLASQKNLTLEVFVVDDCSDEPCAGVIEEYRQRGLNARLFRQAARSYTLAGRLLGMTHARGRWLAFMDADDGLAGDTVYAEAVREADAAAVDVLHFRVLGIDSKGFFSHRSQAAPFHEGRLESREIFSAWADSWFMAHSVWNKLYSRRLYTKVINLPHTVPIFRIEDFYLTTHFLFLAKSYASSDLAVYKYYLPSETHLGKVSGRAFDALRMYLSFPGIFASYGMDEELREKMKAYLRAMIIANGGKLCGFLPDDIWKNRPYELDFNSQAIRTILEYGTKQDFLMLLLIINSSNVRKLRDLKNIVTTQLAWSSQII